MKVRIFYQPVLLALFVNTSNVNAFTPSTSLSFVTSTTTSTHNAPPTSSTSTLLTSSDKWQRPGHHQQTQQQSLRTSTTLLYEPNDNNGGDPNNKRKKTNRKNSKAQDALDSGFWNALSYTEQWISKTLKEASKTGKSNPYARKELNYVCEMNEHTLASVSGIFRRFREAREMGERHAYAEEHMVRKDPSHEKNELRQTQVIIVPFCQYFATFHAFEGVIKAINLARLNAKDLVTDVSMDRMGIAEEAWIVNINGATLHPRYGEKTPKEIMEEMEQFEKDGEVDLNKADNLRRKNNARRSPYPTLIVEVQASPPGQEDKSGRTSDIIPSTSLDGDDDLAKRGVLKDIVAKLEDIFAKSAALHKKTTDEEMEMRKKNDNSFYDAIGNAMGVEEVFASDPISTTQKWVIENDPLYNPNISSFTSADVTHADAAYEFVFSNLAMNRYSPTEGGRRKNYDISSRSYLIMPKFVSSSATSLEIFMTDVKNIIDSIDGLNERVSLSHMHPEHVEVEKRSPVPVLILQWYAEKNN